MGFDIITPNLDASRTDPITGRSLVNEGFENNLSQVKFESVMHDARPEPKKPSIISRIFSFLGGFAPLAAFAAPFTGGLSLIGAAGLGAMGNAGNKSIANHNAAEAASLNSRPVSVSYPGMTGALASDPTLALVSNSRDASMSDAIHRY